MQRFCYSWARKEVPRTVRGSYGERVPCCLGEFTAVLAGCVLLKAVSFALGIKMNILLLLPGLLVLLVQLRGVAGTAESIAIIGLIQVSCPIRISRGSSYRSCSPLPSFFPQQVMHVHTLYQLLISLASSSTSGLSTGVSFPKRSFYRSRLELDCSLRR